jgi:hypothetical protein
VRGELPKPSKNQPHLMRGGDGSRVEAVVKKIKIKNIIKKINLNGGNMSEEHSLLIRDVAQAESGQQCENLCTYIMILLYTLTQIMHIYL